MLSGSGSVVWLPSAESSMRCMGCPQPPPSRSQHTVRAVGQRGGGLLGAASHHSSSLPCTSRLGAGLRGAEPKMCTTSKRESCSNRRRRGGACRRQQHCEPRADGFVAIDSTLFLRRAPPPCSPPGAAAGSGTHPRPPPSPSPPPLLPISLYDAAGARGVPGRPIRGVGHVRVAPAAARCRQPSQGAGSGHGAPAAPSCCCWQPPCGCWSPQQPPLVSLWGTKVARRTAHRRRRRNAIFVLCPALAPCTHQRPCAPFELRFHHHGGAAPSTARPGRPLVSRPAGMEPFRPTRPMPLVGCGVRRGRPGHPHVSAD